MSRSGLHGPQPPGKRLSDRLLIERNLLQLGTFVHVLQCAIQDPAESPAILAELLDPLGGVLQGLSTPGLEQVQKTVEQLAVAVAQQLIANIAELQREAPKWLHQPDVGAGPAEALGRLAAHLAE